MATKKSSKKAASKRKMGADDDVDRIGRTVRLQKWVWDELDNDRKPEKRSASTHIEYILEKWFEAQKLQEESLDNVFIEYPSLKDKRK